jgi:RNA polymerase sigma-70 factor (ECF subfamily)
VSVTATNVLDTEPIKIEVEQLYRTHSHYVRNYLRRIGVSDFSVDDSVQEVFLVAHKYGGYIPGKASPRTWLCAIAIRVAANARRSVKNIVKKEEGYASIVEYRDKQYTPEDLVILRHELVRVNRLLCMLNDTHRAILLDFNVNKSTCEEIAENTNVPVGTVYSRLHSARKSFREAVSGAGQ